MNEYEDGACCQGKSNCCGGAEGFGRREFMRRSALGAGTLGIAGAARGRDASPAAEFSKEEQADFERWTSSLLEAGERRVYRGDELQKIAMPMGGLGCGQLYLSGTGDISAWLIVNNFTSGAWVNCPSFGLWFQESEKSPDFRWLASATPNRPGFSDLQFSGEYPFAWIEYRDNAALPVAVRLESYSPFIPLDAKNSGLPTVIFRFALENRTQAPLAVSLLGLLPNLVGWDGSVGLETLEHVDFFGQENRVVRDGDTTHILLGAKNGLRDRISPRTILAVNDREIAYRLRLVHGLKVSYRSPLSVQDGPEPTVYWCGDVPSGNFASELDSVLKRVADGAGLVISNGMQGLLASSAKPWKRSRAKTFEDWERGGYDGWDLSGECFGPKPAGGTLPGQQPVSGGRGDGMVNTFFQGDGTQGVAKSRSFKIKQHFIHLLVGGGGNPVTTCVNLVDRQGRVIQTAHGDNSEQLKPVLWNVWDWRGQEFHIEVVDKSSEGWGHILLDDIVFSDSATTPFARPEVPKSILDALPLRWSGAVDEELAMEAPGMAQEHVPLQIRRHWRLKGMALKPGAEVLLYSKLNTPLVVAGPHGKGRIVICLGDPLSWTPNGGDKHLLMTLLANASGATYAPAALADVGDAPFDQQIAGMPHFGTMVLSVRGGNLSVCAQWNDLDAVTKRFSQDGGLPPSGEGVAAPYKSWNAAASSSVMLGAGEKQSIEFTISWHFPNRTRTKSYGWGPPDYQYDYRLGNQYNKHFANALEVATYVDRERHSLDSGTRAFHAAFYSTTAPRYFLDAITANISILRSPIYIWLEDGTVGGFEGSDACCPMNCTHVYNYAMAMPYLFPTLERNVRELDFLVNRDPARNFITHRTALPLSEPRLGDELGGPHHHALDGELGALLKLYREWQVCGDRSWLECVWPAAKLVMEHVLKEHDVDGDGVLKGEQPNTYDTHLFGSNMFIGGLYLASLRAMEALAGVLSDTAFATLMRERFEHGSRGYDAILWNGEYYENLFNAPGEDPKVYNDNNCYGPGCHADQLLGQWWACQLGLGNLCDESRLQTTIDSIMRYNWRKTLRDHQHTQRVFAEGSEKGLLIVTWPKGGRPERPMLYCDEVWTGIEYAFAGVCLRVGKVTEALQIIRGARDRYTGNQRNPWSEIECGGHYARAMSSYALLHAAAGLHYDAAAQRLAIAPRFNRDAYTTFFSTATGWGTASILRSPGNVVLTVATSWGEITLSEVHVDEQMKKARLASGKPLRARQDILGTAAYFGEPITCRKGEDIAVIFSET